MSSSSVKPPIARREEDRVVYAGVAPPGWNKEVPRQAEGSPHKLLDPPVAVPDPYGWLRDDTRKNEEVLDLLKAENAYSQEMTKHLEGLRGTLYDEMLSSIQETDYTVPRPKRDYYRYSRTFEGKSYPMYCRAPRTEGELKIDWDGSADKPILPGEEILLDVNELAKDKDYCSLGALAVSPSQKLMAYTVDFTGDEKCHLWVMDLATREIVDHDPELKMDGHVCWGKDDKSLFYLTLDDTERPYRLWRRRLVGKGEEKQADELVHQENDPLFWSGFGKTLDDKYFILHLASSETTEIWYLDLDEDIANPSPKTTLQCIAKRRFKVLFDVDHRHGKWWITSNVEETPNMRLFTAPAKPNCEGEWSLVLDPSTDKPLFDGSYERVLDGVSTFSNHVVAHGRQGGIPRVWILDMDPNHEEQKVTKFEALTFPEAAYDVGLSTHYEFDVDKIVVAYDSLITPLQYMEVSLSNPTGPRTVIKFKNVPGYDKSLYDCERFMVRSRDGTTDIPVVAVYKKDVMEKHKADGKPVHTHLYGYGSYGACIEADFRATRLALLNRGIVYVIAQIRGGGEMGRQWYEESNGAKFLCKKNTFNDFVDCARHLIDTKRLTSPDLLACEGRSAVSSIFLSIISAPLADEN
jgi:oligopeptidase B